MKTHGMTLILLLIVPLASADYVLSVNDGAALIRITDSGLRVWQTDCNIPNAGRQLEMGPLDGDIYVAFSAGGDDRVVQRYDFETGVYLGDATGAQSAYRINDLQWGYDYDNDGVADLWTISQDGAMEVYDGNSLDNLPGTLLDSWQIADVDPYDGMGGRGFVVGPDITGDGIGEMYCAKGLNDANNKINVWDPVALQFGILPLARVASYPATEMRESLGMILGPDVNGDGQQDLWVANQRRNEVRAYDYSNGDDLGKVDIGVDVIGGILDVDEGPDGTVLVVTRFASSLDPDWDPAYNNNKGEVPGGNLVQYDPNTGVSTLIYEHDNRVDAAVYVKVERRPIPKVTPGLAPEQMTIYQPVGQPVIDGDLSEWIDSGAVFKFIGNAGDVIRGAWAGPDDTSAVWSMMWDANNLYFAAAVRDDVYTPVTAVNANWKSDNLLLYIDTDLDGVADNKTSMFLLDGIPAVRQISIDPNAMQVAIVRDPRLGPGGMLYEASIALTALNNFPAEAGSTFGMSPGLDEGTTAPDSGKFLSWLGVNVDTQALPVVTLGTAPTPAPTEGLPDGESLAIKAKVRPQIDGCLSDWTGQNAVFNYIGYGTDVMRGAWAGPQDTSAVWSVMWDDTHLYFAIVVTDDIYTPVTAVNTNWRSDNVLLYIDTDSDGTADNKISVFLLDGAPLMRQISIPAEAVELAIVRDTRLGGGGMVYEIAVALDGLTNLVPAVGGRFRMSPGLDEGITAPDSGKFLSWYGVNVDTGILPIVTFVE